MASISSLMPSAGAVAQAEVAVEVLALADGENAGGGEDAVVADDEAAVVQRRLRLENGDDQFRRELAVDVHAALGEDADVGLPLDGDERAELAVGQFEDRLGDDLEGLAALVRGGEEVMAARAPRGRAAAPAGR